MSEKKTSFLSSVYYVALAKYIGIVINLIISGILARLLSPNDFGVIAISMIFINFFTIISDIGIGPAIIQKKDLSDSDISGIFTITIYAAVVISIAFFFSAKFVAIYYNTPILTIICQILTINLFFAIANIVPNGLLLKDKRFKFISTRTVIIQFIGGFFAIIAALRGLGIYSLLITPIFTSVFVFFVNFFSSHISFSFKMNIAPMKKIFSYSIFQFFFTLINYFSRNLDNLLIGKIFGMNSLGYYEKSYRLMMLPLSNITSVLTPVMHPFFSDYQSNIESVVKRYLNIIKYLAFIGMPLSVFLFFSSKEMVLLVFGNHWIQSVPVFKLLSLSVGFQVIVSSAGSIFQATNNTKLLFIDGLISTTLTISCLLIGLFIYGNLNAIALLISFAFTINFFKSYFILFKLVFKTSMRPFFESLIVPIVMSIFLGIALYLFSLVSMGLFLSFILKCAIYLILTLGFGLIFKDYNIISIIRGYVAGKQK